MSSPILPNSYTLAIAALLTPRVAELGPGTPNLAMRESLARLNLGEHPSARACHAGLWLYHDFLDESHSISQDLLTTEGSFWHAIMHRREPDPSNAKYWWRRVGSHPVLDRLREQTPAIGFRFTTAEAFVDFCESVRGTGTADEETAKQVQSLEWHLLFDWCTSATPAS